MALTLQQLSEQLGLSYSGNPDIEIKNVASLGGADSGDLSFLVNSKDKNSVEQSNCSVLIVPEEFDISSFDKAYKKDFSRSNQKDVGSKEDYERMMAGLVESEEMGEVQVKPSAVETAN